VYRINEKNEQIFKEKCAVLRYYAESSGDFSPTLRDNLSVPSSGVTATNRNSFIGFINICYIFRARRPSSGIYKYITLNLTPPQKKIICILNLWVLRNCNLRYFYSYVFYFWILKTCIFKYKGWSARPKYVA